MRRRPLSFAQKLAGGLVVAATVLLMMEGGARLLGPIAPQWQGSDPGGVVMVGHPTRLWGMGEGARQNAGAVANINASGLRGPKPSLPRPPERARVMVLGDSSFFGHGLSDSASPSAVIEAGLKARGIDVDVVNGAIPGYSTEQSLLLMEEQGWALEPSLLLVGSLWSDSNFDHFRDADLLHTRAEYADNPMANSRLYRLLAAIIDRARGGDVNRVVGWTRSSEWPETGTRRVPLQRYAHNLDQLARDAAAKGIGVAFIAPCNLPMVVEPVRDRVWGTYFDAQESVARHHGVPVIPLLPSLIGQGEAKDLFLDQMHPSATGAALWAGEVVNALVAAGWPQDKLIATGGVYDPSWLEDAPLEELERHRSERSPQSNLFPGTPADKQRKFPGGGVVKGRVEGGAPPVDLRAYDRSGREMGGMNLPAIGPFSFDVAERTRGLRVVAIDANGKRMQVEVLEGQGPLMIRF